MAAASVRTPRAEEAGGRWRRRFANASPWAACFCASEVMAARRSRRAPRRPLRAMDGLAPRVIRVGPSLPPSAAVDLRTLERFVLDPQEHAGLSQSNPDEELCCICLETMLYCKQAPQQLMRLPCGHVQHADCAVRWLSTNNSCPTCRHPVTHNTVVSDHGVPPGEGHAIMHSEGEGHASVIITIMQLHTYHG